jgi:hypothetical protein
MFNAMVHKMMERADGLRGKTRYPVVSQKVRAMSASTSVCNLLRSATIPTAFRSQEMVMLFAKGVHDVEVLRRARRDMGSSNETKSAGRRDTHVVLGKTHVALSREDANALADDIVKRVAREDLCQSRIDSAQEAAEGYRRAFTQKHSVHSNASASALRRTASLSSSGSFSLRSFRSPRQPAVWDATNECTILLFPRIVRATERWLQRVRARIAERAIEATEMSAAHKGNASLKRQAWRRWIKMYHGILIGRRASLNRIVKQWQRLTQRRAQERMTWYHTLHQVIARCRLHRLLCAWYAYHVAESALRRKIDPYELLLRRDAGSSIYERRPEIIFAAIDAAHAMQVKDQRVTEAIVHHQSKSLRLPWDAWRAYIFVRRTKQNHYHMLRLYRSGRVATRVMAQCLHKWRFRMNASRSLSLYLYRLQTTALSQWRDRAELMVADRERMDQRRVANGTMTKRSCMALWRQKSKESTILDLTGSCRVLEHQAKLMPYAFIFAQLISESHERGETAGPAENWSEGRANAALCCRCFQQWRRCWTRRKQFLVIVKQQHRLYCGLLLRRALTVWRSPDLQWDDTAHLYLLVESIAVRETVAMPSQSTASGRETKEKEVAPSVRLFGPRIEDVMIPWTSLRAVERHCRRSYSALGNLQSVSMFAPKRLLEVDTSLFCPSSAASEATKWIADAIWTESLTNDCNVARGGGCYFGSSVQQRCLSQSSTSTITRLELEPSVSGDNGEEGSRWNATCRRKTERQFYRFLLGRMVQALFVLGRVVIASRHAVTRLNEFRDLMFSKHVVLSRERIADLQDVLHGFAVDSGISAPVSRSQRLRTSVSKSGALASNGFSYQLTDRLANTCGYLDACIAQRNTEFLSDGHLVTEQQAFVARFSSQIQAYKESLLHKYKQQLLIDAPMEILMTLARLGFPMIELTDVELYLEAIASFLNARIAENVALRIAFRMRRAFVLKRWAVVDAGLSFWTAAGMPCTAGRQAPKPPNSPKRRSTRARSAANAADAAAPPCRKKQSPLVWKRRSLRSEHLALAIAIRLRVNHSLRHLPLSYTPASVVCLVPPKTVVQTISRSQNAPDKLARQ